jgi:cytidyltransferase-like protein
VGIQEISSLACIHGRFQPFHFGHVDYLNAALKHWPNIIVGLTAVNPVENPSKGVEHRGSAVANPLSYWERMTLIKAGLNDIGVSESAVSFVPFPIDQPETLKYAIPKSIICATTNLYEWNHEKVTRLRDAGYSTHILNECVKVKYDGATIRKQIIAGNPEWKRYVPRSSVLLLEEWDIRGRLIALFEGRSE